MSSNFAASPASAASFNSPSRRGSVSVPPSPGEFGQMPGEFGQMPGEIGQMPGEFGHLSESLLFQDIETIDKWRDHWIAKNNVLLAKMSAVEFKASMLAFGKEKYTSYVMRQLSKPPKGAVDCTELLRQCIMTSMYFEQQQGAFAKDFVAIVCRRIIELAGAYNE